MKNIIWLFLVLVIFVGGYLFINNDSIDSSDSINHEDSSISEELAVEEVVRERSEEVLISINEEDIDNFKDLVHPTQGVRFSRYGVVLPEEDQRLTASEIDKLVETNERVLWGYADGSGLPINKTFSEYFSDLARQDYINAPQSSYGTAIRGGANTVNNINEEYPSSYFVSYHYPHTQTHIEEDGKEVPLEMSWITLNLVFREYLGEYYLVGVVEDSWTI